MRKLREFLSVCDEYPAPIFLLAMLACFFVTCTGNAIQDAIHGECEPTTPTVRVEAGASVSGKAVEP